VALPATEDFAGGAAALSGSWTQQLAAVTINKNGSGLGTQSGTSLNNPTAFWNADVFNNDHYSQIAIVAFNGNFVEPVVRASGTGNENFYGHYTNGSGTRGVEKAVAGTFTDLGATSTAVSNGDTVRLEASGSTLTAKLNGVITGTFPDGTFASGAPGIAANASAGTLPTFDSWQGDNLLSGAPSSPQRRPVPHQQRRAA
jgi:hypothetical protein